MGVFSRLSDIFNSNINSLLDNAEDPEKMVRLIIHEMEETLVEVRSDLAGVIAERKTVIRDQERLNALAEDWESKAELALNKQREDLAKAALVEKNRALDQAAAVVSELDMLDEAMAKFQDDIGALQKKIDDAKARQKTILMRAKTAEGRLTVRKRFEKTKSNEVALKFDRFENKLNTVESQLDAYDAQQKSLADEISELAVDEKIDQELEDLKAKMSKAESKTDS